MDTNTTNDVNTLTSADRGHSDINGTCVRDMAPNDSNLNKGVPSPPESPQHQTNPSPLGPSPSGSPQHLVNPSPDQKVRYVNGENDFLLIVRDGNCPPPTTEPKKVDPKKEKELEAALEEGPEERETWGKKADFLLSIIGFAVDLANVWRFPYLCYKNGGGAFLIPYFLSLLFGAIPLFFMELILGQFHREGAISVWKISPIFKGIGMAECLIAYLVAFYYNVIIAWSLYYLVKSFTLTLPWTKCDHDFNTPLCLEKSSNFTANLTKNNSVTSAAEYYERGVLGLHMSNGLQDVGGIRWELVLCLMGVFVMLYLSLWKGVKSSGKVVWVTATMPYAVLTILLIRGVMLPGSLQGIIYFITPDLSKLLNSEVWTDAAVQIFYSVGAGFGVHIAYASYNKFDNNCYRDCIATVFVNSFTSLFSGFVIFSYLGYMSHSTSTDISKVATQGPGLVFVVYPEAISTLPGSFFWSIIFFIMLITLGLDSAMGGLEAVLTGVRDEIKRYLPKHRFEREIFTFFVVLSAFLFAMQNVTMGGIYLFTIWDSFAAGTSILFAVFSLSIAVGWVYGIDQFVKDIEKMLGFTPNWYWRICWKFISPLFLFTIIVSSIVSFKPLQYESYTLGTYVYPYWANTVGWLIAFSSMSMVPAAAIYQVAKAPGNSIKQKIAIAISPHWEHKAILEGKPVTRFQIRHWLKV